MKVINLTIKVQEKKIIENLNFEFEEPGKMLVVGKNGAGKSTLIKTLAGMLKPIQGEISNKDTLTYVPDSSERYFVGISPKVYFNFLRMRMQDSTTFDCQLMHYLKRFSFSELLLNQKIDSLSLGEQRKVMLIGSFLINPDIYLMDEPLSGLDNMATAFFLSELNNLVNTGKKFIIVSHDQQDIFSPVKQILTI